MPSINRLIFVRCVKIIKIGIAKATHIIYSKPSIEEFKIYFRKINAKRKVIEPKIEPSETYLENPITIIKVIVENKNSIGASANIKPIEVATPLPPLKLPKIVQMCPITAALPPKIFKRIIFVSVFDKFEKERIIAGRYLTEKNF